MNGSFNNIEGKEKAVELPNICGIYTRHTCVITAIRSPSTNTFEGAFALTRWITTRYQYIKIGPGGRRWVPTSQYFNFVLAQ